MMSGGGAGPDPREHIRWRNQSAWLEGSFVLFFHAGVFHGGVFHWGGCFKADELVRPPPPQTVTQISFCSGPYATVKNRHIHRQTKSLKKIQNRRHSGSTARCVRACQSERPSPTHPSHSLHLFFACLTRSHRTHGGFRTQACCSSPAVLLSGVRRFVRAYGCGQRHAHHGTLTRA